MSQSELSKIKSPVANTFDAHFELKALSDDGTFEGYASVFDVEDDMRDVVAAGAFKKSLAAHRKAGRMPALLWQHDRAEPIGGWLDVREDATGLYVKGRLFIADIPRARQAHALLKGGGLSGLSIGFRTVQAEIDENTGIRKLIEIDLFEVSLVTFPALESARVHSVKTAAGTYPSAREVEHRLRGAGFSRRQAKALMARGHKGLEAPKPAIPDDDTTLASLASDFETAAVRFGSRI